MELEKISHQTKAKYRKYLFDNYLDNKLPDVIFAFNSSSGQLNYFHGRRYINTDDGGSLSNTVVLAKSNQTGRELWLLADLGNGDICSAYGRFYFWAFKSKEKAQEFLGKHNAKRKKDKSLVRLSKPQRYYIVSHI